MEQLLLSKFDYYIDKSDPDIVILRRQDGAFVAAFSAIGALIHRSAWKGNSANFGFTEFYEVGIAPAQHL